MDGKFLVFVNFSIIAKDVSTTLEQLGMGIPLIAASEAEALALMTDLAEGAALRLAVVQLSPEDFSISPLRDILEQRGAHVILLHDEVHVSETAPPYPVLAVPFFTEDLERMVAGFGRGL